MATQHSGGGQRPSLGQGGRPARPPASPRQRSDGRPLPPFVRYEEVTAACGHAVQFGLCEDRLDKYRAARRQKVTGRPCPACREQRQREEQEAAARRRTEKDAARPAQQSKRPAQAPPGRLPDGSCFEVRYDAGAQSWSGTLTVGPSRFTATAGGVFRLLSLLDRQYRDSLPVPGAPPAAPPDER